MKKLLLVLLAAAVALAAAAQEDARSLMQEGARLLEQGHADQAELLFGRAVAQAPSDPLAWSWQGRAFLVQGRYEAAAEALQKGLDLEGKTPALGRTLKRETQDSLGLAWAFQKQFQKAREVYAGAVAADPGYAVFRYNLACVCALDGDRAGALSNLAAYLDGARDLPVGKTPVDASRDEDFKGLWGDPAFEGLLRERVGRQPDDTAASSLVRAGAGALGRGRSAEALEQLERAAKADPGDPRAWFYLGGAREAEGKAAEAGEAFARAVALCEPPRVWLTGPMVRVACLAAGRARVTAGDAKGAVPFFEKALGLDAYRPAAAYGLARAKGLLGDGPGALDALTRAQAQRENLLPVEPRLPDPVTDPAFQPFRGKPGWEAIFPEAPAARAPAEGAPR